jgi:DNA end-binding protein Ku
MAARAIWKAVLHCGEVRVPVKLYSALEDQSVRFRVLSRKHLQPVRQALVNPETDAVVPHEETRRAYVSENGDRVILEPSELAALEPEASRDIELLSFLPPGEIDHRWYERPYYLGPDGDSRAYFALAEALEASGLEGLAHWVMRGREYVGALRLYQGYPMLLSLRHAGEVIAVEELKAPTGPALNPKELAMARQLIGMLDAELDLANYHDDYRRRVLELVETKAKGRRLRLVRPPVKVASDDLSGALRASLKAARKTA